MTVQELRFPSPLRGLIFHSSTGYSENTAITPVSVPSSGTYLPFKMSATEDFGAKSFRPLFGDLSSILSFNCTMIKGFLEFPSPLRGLIFH